MDVHEIKLSVQSATPMPPKTLDLPRWVKPIKIGERTFLFKWTFMGWKQLSIQEELELKLGYGV